MNKTLPQEHYYKFQLPLLIFEGSDNFSLHWVELSSDSDTKGGNTNSTGPFLPSA
jgi:hypothetical protein